MTDTTEGPHGIILNYPETIFYPAWTLCGVDTLRFEWPATGLTLDFDLSKLSLLSETLKDLHDEAWDDSLIDSYRKVQP